MSSKQIAGKPERYYVKNGVLFANSDYEPQRVVADSTNDLIAVQDKLEPGAIGHVAGTDVNFELGINNTWVGQSGVPMVKPEDLDTITDQVIFIDYDGSVVVSYTKDLFMEMTEMPPNPKHEGLISQGWNWDLDRIKYYLEKYPDCVMTVGQMYCTADGATHIHMNVQGRLTVPLMFQQDVSEGVVIDWGDGTKETVAGTGVVTTEHTYASEGKYILRMKAADGCEIGFGGTLDETYCNIFGETTLPNMSGVQTRAASSYYAIIIDEIYFSNDITTLGIGYYAFNGCHNLKYLTLPKSLINIPAYSFDAADSLTSIIIPSNVDTINHYALSNIFSVQYISIPENVETIANYAFQNDAYCVNLFLPEKINLIGSYTFGTNHRCTQLILNDNITNINSYAFTTWTNLKKLHLPLNLNTIGKQAFINARKLFELIIPETVTSIGEQAFANSKALRKIILKSIIPPTLVKANAFTNIPNCIIYVPYSEDHSILEAYKTATNWSVYADQMIESEPDESETNEPEETPTEP